MVGFDQIRSITERFETRLKQGVLIGSGGARDRAELPGLIFLALYPALERRGQTRYQRA